MRINGKPILTLALIAGVTMGAKCISVADNNVIVVNVENLTGTYAVTPGTLQFASPNNCVTKQPADYIDSDYGQVVGGRLVDAQFQTVGTFAGSVTGGTVTVNGVQLLSYSGPWSTFNTSQSLLTGTQLTSHPAGIAQMITAIQNSQPVTVCVGGAFSQAASAGLSIMLNLFAQVDVEP